MAKKKKEIACRLPHDISMGSTTVIREVRSSSYPIAVKLESTSITSSTEPPQMSQASATLSQESTDLGKDFNLEIVHDNVKKPRAWLETYVGNPPYGHTGARASFGFGQTGGYHYCR